MITKITTFLLFFTLMTTASVNVYACGSSKNTSGRKTINKSCNASDKYCLSDKKTAGCCTLGKATKDCSGCGKDGCNGHCGESGCHCSTPSQSPGINSQIIVDLLNVMPRDVAQYGYVNIYSKTIYISIWLPPKIS